MINKFYETRQLPHDYNWDRMTPKKLMLLFEKNKNRIDWRRISYNQNAI